MSFLIKKDGEMAAGSMNIVDFAASGGSWAYFGTPAAARRCKKKDFVTQEVSEEGAIKPKGCLQEAKRMP